MSLETFEKLPDDKKELILSTGIKAFSQKSYKEVSTDSITQACQISKGILFHYFGSKKEYYLYCLEKAMERLTSKTETPRENDFYEILFASMNRKISVCLQYKDEMHMVNMASRDASTEIAAQKTEILRRYKTVVESKSVQTLRHALAVLRFKDEHTNQVTTEGLYMLSLCGRGKKGCLQAE